MRSIAGMLAADTHPLVTPRVKKYLASIVAVLRVFKITIPDTPTIDRIIATCDHHEAFASAAPGLQQGAPK